MKLKGINLMQRAESGPWPWSNGPCGLQRTASQKATMAPVGQPGPIGEIGRAGPLSQRGVGAPPERSPRIGQLRWRGRRRQTRSLDSSLVVARAQGGCGECTGQLHEDEGA
jgi:hypothetical protein